MKMAPISCIHDTRVTTSGETVCANCGMVMEERVADKPFERNSKTNLWERHGLGSQSLIPNTEVGKKLKRCIKNAEDKKTHRNSEDLKKISNCCQKLKFAEPESEYSLKLYNKYKNSLGSRKYAYVAIWALYKTCKIHGIPIHQKKIISTVSSEFRKSKFPHISKILYEMKEVRLDAAEDDEKYSFGLALKEMTAGKKFSQKKFAVLKRDAYELFKDVYTEGSPRRRARLAIEILMGGKK